MTRVDERLIELFGNSKASKSETKSAHGIAASIHPENSQEILNAIPSLGPVTYLPNLEVIIADVEADGFDYLVNNRDVHAISDSELMHNIPKPLDTDSKSSLTSRDMMRGELQLFSDNEGKGITVAVMDTGVYAGHESLKGRVLEQVSCVHGDYSGGDNNGHGTHVAGSIAGEGIGVASESTILDLRVFGKSSGASTSSILQALDTCISREVDILNMSLGSNYPSQVLDNAVDTVVQEGIIACVAAGNSGPSSGTINSPSSARLALSVAATDSNKRVASFSSRGPCKWNAWPKPDCSGFGVDVLSASHRGGYCVMSGTSMASPGVAGVLACLLEHEKDNSDGGMLVDHLVRNGGDSIGQPVESVGTGFISLEGIENFLSPYGGIQNMATKKRKKTVSRNFFTDSTIKCSTCNTNRTVHQMSLRLDGTMRIRMSCSKHLSSDDSGQIIFDEVILENWKHARIPDKQLINSLRKCGSCGKSGLVPIEYEVIKIDNKHLPHTKVKVGCLYCSGKGLRKIPKRIADIWTN
jgi:hypothetical protein